MSIPLIYLPTVDSTNKWAKENFEQLAPVGVVYTTSQTAGRGRLGRSWENAAGEGLYYTVAYSTPLHQPSALPLFASFGVAAALKKLYGVQTAVKWPNDLLVGGKKICGILCEGTRNGIVCGIGVNLKQNEAYFERANLPHATSLALQGYRSDEESARRLAEYMTEYLTGQEFERFARLGLAAFLEEYRNACINLGRHVTFDGGSGIAETIDEEGRLVVRCDGGNVAVLSGEVSVKGIYGAVE